MFEAPFGLAPILSRTVLAFVASVIPGTAFEPIGAAVFSCDESGLDAAIAAGGGPHTFDCAGPTTITTSSEKTLALGLILDGEDLLSLSGGSTHRVLTNTATTELRRLTIRDGAASGRGGGILNQGTLTLANVSVVDCTTGSEGGGISNQGQQLVARNTIISGNSAANSEGGGIFGGTAALRNVILDGNRAVSGGAISDVVLTAEAVTISNNVATGNQQFAGAGGGIFLPGGSATLQNVTLSGNAADQGSAIYLAIGTLDLEHVTIAGNSGAPDAIFHDDFDLVTARNTLIEGGCSNTFTGSDVVSLGGNVESPGDTCQLDDPTDQTGVSGGSLLLSPLADNGGAVQTHALEPGSVLEDAGVVPCLTTDARGILRPLASCDAGAVEQRTSILAVVTQSDDAVHFLTYFFESEAISFGIDPSDGSDPVAVATDGETLWVGTDSNSVIGYGLDGTALYSWGSAGTLNGLGGMDFVDPDLALVRSTNLHLRVPTTGESSLNLGQPPCSGSGGAGFDGATLWTLCEDTIEGVDPADGSSMASIPNAAAGCTNGGSGLASNGFDELTIVCDDGSWFRVLSADGSVSDAGAIGLDMFGVKVLPLPEPHGGWSILLGCLLVAGLAVRRDPPTPR